jgi:muconolactone delta-isomerase
MEYLVTMTTHVPEGTTAEAVDDMRTREGARAKELASAGQLLRLWRPPLAPGQWRTFGLFSAQDDAALESTLASMPLRVWRTDEVTALLPHPNDPASNRKPSHQTEFLIDMAVTVPDGTPAAVVESTERGEAERAAKLAEQDHIHRIWGLPGSRILAVWSAADDAELHDLLDSLPLRPWMAIETTALSVHPSDPAVSRA